MRRSVALAALALATIGCRKAARSAPPEPVAAVAMDAAPATPWAGLFVDGRALVYEVKIDQSVYDDDTGKFADDVSTESLLCRSRVTQVGHYQLAALDCAEFDGRMLADELSQVFVTDGERLWRLGVIDDTDEAAIAATLAETEPDLTRDQQPVSREDEADDDHHSDGSYEITAVDDGWCVQSASPGPHVSVTRWCVSARRGLTVVATSEDGSEFLGYEATLTEP